MQGAMYKVRNISGAQILRYLLAVSEEQERKPISDYTVEHGADLSSLIRLGD
jgi:hypothetical protein